MHIYSRYIKNLISSRKCKKEELADQSQKVVCNQDKFCNTAYQELEEISQQNQYDELHVVILKLLLSNKMSKNKVIINDVFLINYNS